MLNKTCLFESCTLIFDDKLDEHKAVEQVVTGTNLSQTNTVKCIKRTDHDNTLQPCNCNRALRSS